MIKPRICEALCLIMMRSSAARSVIVESDSGYVNSRWAFLAVLNFELNVLAFSQT